MKANTLFLLSLLIPTFLLVACSRDSNYSYNGEDPTTAKQNQSQEWDGNVKGHTFVLTCIFVTDETLFMSFVKNEYGQSYSSVSEAREVITQLYFDSWGILTMKFKLDNKCEVTYPGSKYGGDGITSISTYVQNGDVVALTTYSSILQDGSELVYENQTTDYYHIIDDGIRYDPPVYGDESAGFYIYCNIQDN